MFYSIDRFEGKYAVLQDDGGNNADIELSLLPKDIKQGDILICKDVKWIHDDDEKAVRRERILKLQKKLTDM